MILNSRTLNKFMILDRYPILMVDELLDEMHYMTVFLKLDLKSSYNQICMKVKDILKMTFWTREDIMSSKWCLLDRVMHQPHSNHLRTKFFNLTFGNSYWCSVMISSLYNKDMERSEEHMVKVFTLLCENHLHVKNVTWAKSRWSIWVSAQGVKIKEGRIKVSRDGPVPVDTEEFCSFLLLAGNSCQFCESLRLHFRVPNVFFENEWIFVDSGISRSLRGTQICPCIRTGPCPTWFQRTRCHQIRCLRAGMGKALGQEGRPIASPSWASPTIITNKLAYEIELYALVMAVEKLQHYLLFRLSSSKPITQVRNF